MSGEPRLRLADNVRIEARATGFDVRRGSQRTFIGSLGLAVLDAFREPRTMANALNALKPRMAGGVAWVETSSDIVNLHRAGILFDADCSAPQPVEPGGRGWAQIGRHVGLLNDSRRVDCFLAAVRAVVKPGDVVLDLGTGTGLLAIAAAQAGASRVYAIEETEIAAVAQANFRANGYEDRIKLIRGRSTHVDLPERADVIVSEIIGTDALGEGIVRLFKDARERLLKPDARFVPHRLQVFALPVAAPEHEVNKAMVTRDLLKTWRSRYGIDFSGTSGRHSNSFTTDPRALAGKAIGTPVLVYDARLATVKQHSIHMDGAFDATASALLNGVLAYFEAETSPGIRLSTHPDRVGADNHWHQRVWLIPEPLGLDAGRRYRLQFSLKHRGRPDGVQVQPMTVATARG